MEQGVCFQQLPYLALGDNAVIGEGSGSDSIIDTLICKST